MYKLSRPTIAFHWLTAITILGLMGLGFYMANTNTNSLYPLHKALGALSLLLILPRVVWRLREGWPKPLEPHKKREITAARTVHWVLLIAMVGMPVSGVIMSATNGYGLSIFGLDVFPRVPDPANPGAVLIPSPFWDTLTRWVHEWLSYLLAGAVAIHIAAAIKHHFFNKDHTLRRMLNFRR
ncbi:cytochrome b [Marinimicrobium sp. ABcell2]|uniref:cytochrome b n=1 Tax=Marinimicrobium sp. ABcell2 TaxID=3069751 RepID=UPI0027B6C413|nr:cytochrome b/b6 domain-containing protein [Marinimicrobium sp. ABcell2]MDQ2077004.1 cytochrome b/b6 domain-containing protein [Marinimicrobium sp. ABcell2]